MTTQVVIGIILWFITAGASAAVVRVGVTLIGEKRPGWEPRNVILARKLCERAGLTCEILASTPQRSFTELHAGRLHFVMSLEPRANIPEPIKLMRIRASKIVVVAKKPMDACENLNGTHLATLQHTLYSQKLIERCPGIFLEWTTTYEQTLKMYRSGRVDGMVGSIQNFQDTSDPSLRIQSNDIITVLDQTEVWLFGNPASRDSEAAARLQTAILEENPL